MGLAERSPAATGAVTTRWITAGGYDLLWYIGPCLVTYLLMYLHFGMAVSVMALWWFWVVVVDGPHVFGTISRTYLDAEEWRSHKTKCEPLTGQMQQAPTAVTEVEAP